MGRIKLNSMYHCSIIPSFFLSFILANVLLLWIFSITLGCGLIRYLIFFATHTLVSQYPSVFMKYVYTYGLLNYLTEFYLSLVNSYSFSTLLITSLSSLAQPYWRCITPAYPPSHYVLRSLFPFYRDCWHGY